MQITTSKPADAKIRALAKKLAAHLGGAHHLSRGGRSLERLEALVRRAGGRTLLVMGGPAEGPGEGRGGKTGSPAPVVALVRSRQMGEGRGNAADWSWRAEALIVKRLEFFTPVASAREPGTPIKIRMGPNAESRRLADFLGLRDEALASLYDEAQIADWKAEEGEAGLGIGRRKILQIRYGWETP